jgi:hypothetical protein
MSSTLLLIIADLKESILNHAQQLESLDSRISAIDPNLTDLNELKSGPATPVHLVSASGSRQEVECPLK